MAKTNNNKLNSTFRHGGSASNYNNGRGNGGGGGTNNWHYTTGTTVTVGNTTTSTYGNAQSDWQTSRDSFLENASSIILSWDEEYIRKVIDKLNMKQLEIFSGQLTELLIDVQKRLVEEI